MGFAPDTPAIRQTLTWDCSAASLAWVLDALGRPTSESDAIGMLNGNINAAVGLTDASGAPLTGVLQSQGFDASNGSVSYDDVLGMASSSTPMAMGGRAFNHWVGVRGADGDDLLLANPAPGWMSVGDRMTRNDFARLGPFSAVWVNGVNGTIPASGGPPSGGDGTPVSTPTPLTLPTFDTIVAWTKANPLMAAGIAAAVYLLIH
jgi:hypothetical protein